MVTIARYTQLKKQACGEAPLDPLEMSELCRRISECAQREKEFIYALIMSFAQETQPLFSHYPFSSVQVSEGIEFDMSEFPAQLPCLLASFLNLRLL
jgi:hypothetical protein